MLQWSCALCWRIVLRDRTIRRGPALLCSRAGKSPNNRKALELSAFANEKLGDDKKALLIQQKLMGLPGGNTQWRQDQAFHTGQLYEDQNQKDNAIRAYEKNIADTPTTYATMNGPQACAWRTETGNMPKGCLKMPSN